jgi:hypothetical protein
MNAMNMVVHQSEELTALLCRGLSPITDNRDALLALGFERAYPQIDKGREATIWERSIERPRRPDGHRVLARERAYLVGGAA